GQLDGNILEALLETLPVEFSLVDHNDEVIAWNKHETRIFKRPKGVLGRNVKDCHPKGSLDKVEKIISEMKSGKREKAEFWIDLKIDGESDAQKILIEYYALRDTVGKYLGCLEVSQNITNIQKITGQKRLLD
ncbi:MAG: PAS domain-containing protein, partial [bacterium]